MPRFFVSPEHLRLEPSGSGEAHLAGDDARHAVRVLRLKVGDAVTLLDGAGREMKAVLRSEGLPEVRLEITAVRHHDLPARRLVLVQALAKGDKFDWIVQKATELGVWAIQPVATRHSVVKLDADGAAHKRQRWQAIAREAAEQCERLDVPNVWPPMSLASWRKPAGAICLQLAERTQGHSLSDALVTLTDAPSLCLCVGPEGGWAPEDLVGLAPNEPLPVSLGPYILRTETAGLAALAVTQAHFGWA
ncbi:MAG: 16S rRNA (uracil(1498)-N(3))-methyltransferase [Candidatus Sericytochromatia bacterium]|nr:16S rRNA (uracil(1498)-N(3))-methyltransferase [Candidatus Sericytochromatia bacterium]